MKKYCFIFALPFLLVMCKPTAGSTSGETSTDVSFNESPPGILNWSANAGWEANGTFKKWTFIRLDVPDNNFTKIYAEIAVKIGSVNHEDKGLEGHLRKDDYLDAKQFPIAYITLNGATFDESKNEYSSEAVIKLKGEQQSVPLTFNVSDTSPRIVKGGGTLLREDYNVGDDSGVQNEVGVSFEFELK